MRQLPANITLQKNKLNCPDPWLILLDVHLTDGVNTTTLYFARNTENVNYQGREYLAFSFDIDSMKQTSSGQIPSLVLSIANVTKFIQPYLEKYNGGMGSSIKITVINTKYLAENYTELEMEFDVIACYSTSQSVSFTLGAPNPLSQKHPIDKYIALYCRFKYKGPQCKYSGSLPSCRKTYDDCQTHENESRFGGFIGLREGGYRIV